VEAILSASPGANASGAGAGASTSGGDAVGGTKCAAARASDLWESMCIRAGGGLAALALAGGIPSSRVAGSKGWLGLVWDTVRSSDGREHGGV
jgi:hypothetical protein